jgi:transglutaminase-like putative cysteine protease
MFCSLILATLFVAAISADARREPAAPDFHLVYTANHRATFEQVWKYTFPNHQSTRWVIALRYPPELAWSRDVHGKAELLTSSGWKPFNETHEGSAEKRRMLFINYPHNDPELRHGFTIRTTLTATIYDQHLRRGKASGRVVPLTVDERESYLAATDTFDFNKPEVKKWMNEHSLWKRSDEPSLDFVHRIYKELRLHLPYSTADGGRWVCSQILKVGFGECARHAIVGTSILRANHIPARTVCGLWAIDANSKGAHCWGEFFLDGVGWVLYDTTLDNQKPDSEKYFGNKKGEVLAGMVDFDWVIHAGPFGKQTVPGIDAFPAFWSQGKGSMDNQKLETSTHVRIPNKLH